jgi:signal transduction histidine kinase
VLVLLAAVVIPTACVLYFMTHAMRNEAFAARQKVADAYRGPLQAAAKDVERFWRDRLREFAVPADENPRMKFLSLVSGGACSSAIILDAHHRPVYPDEPVPPAFEPATSQAWNIAWKLEFEQDKPLDAAAAYADIATQADDTPAARALQAQARCLAKAGEKAQAVELILSRLLDPRFASARDSQGRLVVPSGLLLAAELAPVNSPQRKRAVDILLTIVNDYRNGDIAASQRIFLMENLRRIAPGSPSMPTFEAEILVRDYLQAQHVLPETDALRPTQLPGVWQLRPAGENIILLYRSELVVSQTQSFLAGNMPFAGALVSVLSPGETPVAEAIQSITLAEPLSGWRISLTLDANDPLDAAARRQTAAYVWIATLAILATVVLALLVAGFIGRQLRLTRLKNDLIATVSHELKTPLASMRMLVDTVLEGRTRDERQVHDYLVLLSKENERLARLIDNFLTFSRMERNKRAFELADVPPGEIVSAAVEAAGERFQADGCRLNVDVAPGLPAVTGDRDALATVLLNLLDNAHKYSGEEKIISLRAFADGDDVCFQVSDNGIGIPRRALKKIFDRFYQVDRSLTRTVGGCGLGLSIVKFIVAAHGGRVDVASQLGRGSTFTVRLPGNRRTAAATPQE